jgi:hypothetical protein
MVKGKERQNTEYWYFLSFRDPHLNRNLGACNVSVQENSPHLALNKTKELKINPGGEVMIYPVIGPELEPNRLYSRAELIALEYKKVNDCLLG